VKPKFLHPKTTKQQEGLKLRSRVA